MFGIANNTEFLKAIGVNDVDPNTKATLVAGLENLAQQKLVTRLSSRLTDEQAEEFGAITDEKQAYDWLVTNVPDFMSIATSVLEEMKNDILLRRKQVVG